MAQPTHQQVQQLADQLRRSAGIQPFAGGLTYNQGSFQVAPREEDIIDESWPYGFDQRGTRRPPPRGVIEDMDSYNNVVDRATQALTPAIAQTNQPVAAGLAQGVSNNFGVNPKQIVDSALSKGFAAPSKAPAVIDDLIPQPPQATAAQIIDMSRDEDFYPSYPYGDARQGQNSRFHVVSREILPAGEEIIPDTRKDSERFLAIADNQLIQGDYQRAAGYLELAKTAAAREGTILDVDADKYRTDATVKAAEIRGPSSAGRGYGRSMFGPEYEEIFNQQSSLAFAAVKAELPLLDDDTAADVAKNSITRSANGSPVFNPGLLKTHVQSLRPQFGSSYAKYKDAIKIAQDMKSAFGEEYAQRDANENRVREAFDAYQKEIGASATPATPAASTTASQPPPPPADVAEAMAAMAKSTGPMAAGSDLSSRLRAKLSGIQPASDEQLVMPNSPASGVTNSLVEEPMKDEIMPEGVDLHFPDGSRQRTLLSIGDLIYKPGSNTPIIVTSQFLHELAMGKYPDGIMVSGHTPSRNSLGANFIMEPSGAAFR